MTVCFVIPDGTGIKNYLFSNILQYLSVNNVKIIIWHTLTDNAISEIKKIHPNIDIKAYELPFYKESVYERFLRESIAYARLLQNSEKVNNKTILKNWRKNSKKLSLKIFYKLTMIAGYILSKNYNYILRADQKYLQSIEKSGKLKSYTEFLKEHQVESILCTHQRAINAIPAMYAATKMKTKSISAIYSWDNMPKARLNTRSDYYIVWSEYMKNEFKIYYPEIDISKVIVTGTPQFEFYYDKSYIMDKEEFCKKYDLDINKKTICYSGDDRLTSPHDPIYLDELASTIATSELKDKVQILLRRSPVDLSGRFDNVVKKYPHIIKVADPIWHFDGTDDNWTLIYPSIQDIKLLVSTAYHCDLVYNVGSTMAHDFAMFDKPAAYINYDAVVDDKWSTDTIYKFQHFKSQDGLDAVVWIDSKDEIASKVTKALYNPNDIAVDRKKWLDKIAMYRESASENIAKFILG